MSLLQEGKNFCNFQFASFDLRSPQAQWVKRWPTDLAVESSSPAQGEIFSTVSGVSLDTAFHYHLPVVLI